MTDGTAFIFEKLTQWTGGGVETVGGDFGQNQRNKNHCRSNERAA